jgi:small subunit ribosomal protein S17
MKSEKTNSAKQKVLVRAPSATRGRVFQGYVIKRFPKRVVVEFERSVYIQKYERFAKDRTRLHARIPEGIEVSEGDYVKIQECRPLSKIIHFIVLEVVRKS